MFGRERGEDRREGPGGPGPVGGDANRYQMTQRMLSIGDDFWIENERGAKVYKFDGKALRVRQTLIFEDRGGPRGYPSSWSCPALLRLYARGRCRALSPCAAGRTCSCRA